MSKLSIRRFLEINPINVPRISIYDRNGSDIIAVRKKLRRNADADLVFNECMYSFSIPDFSNDLGRKTICAAGIKYMVINLIILLRPWGDKKSLFAAFCRFFSSYKVWKHLKFLVFIRLILI